jgi:hypothetical protein
MAGGDRRRGFQRLLIEGPGQLAQFAEAGSADHSAPKAGKAAQLDGQVISHTGGHFALLSILFEQVDFGLVPKRVGSTIRPTRRLPEFIGAPSNFVFG